MKIVEVYFSKSLTGFYFDDQKAIRRGAYSDGLNYIGNPQTPGFTKIRQKGEAISIQLVLADGQVAKGDCAAVQYSGAGGRDPLFLAEQYLPYLEEEIKPLLLKMDVNEFKANAELIDNLKKGDKKIHTALRYGITQALLHATALTNKVSMAEVIRKEYKITNKVYKRVDIFSQTGDHRHEHADKMILKKVDILPHGLFNNVSKIGSQGELLLEYVIWLRNRIKQLQPENYDPIIQLDVYGTIGIIFEYDIERIVHYINTLGMAVKPFKLQIESPVDAKTRDETVQALKEIRALLDQSGSNVRIVADEWCNTLEDIKYFAENKAGHILQIKTPDLGGINNSIEAVIYCNKVGIGSYVGGTCNETNHSAEVSVHIAVSCEATQILAKPGLGTDEGVMTVYNEMNRLLKRANRSK